MTKDPRNEALADVRDWVLAGLPHEPETLHRVGLLGRVELHFGDWHAAIAAADIDVPPPLDIDVPRDPRRAVDALLGRVPDAAIARFTGIALIDIQERRRWIGGPTFTLAAREAAVAVRLAREAHPVSEIAKRYGVPLRRVQEIRAALGLPVTPTSPLKTRFQRLVASEPTALHRVRAGLESLEPRRAHILRERFLREPAPTLGDLALEMGLTRERVRQLELNALAKLGIVEKPRSWRQRLPDERDAARAPRAVANEVPALDGRGSRASGPAEEPRRSSSSRHEASGRDRGRRGAAPQDRGGGAAQRDRDREHRRRSEEVEDAEDAIDREAGGHRPGEALHCGRRGAGDGADLRVRAPSLPPVRRSVRVPLGPQHAFDLFVRRLPEWWPLQTRSVLGADTESWSVECVVGGRLRERARDGREALWGTFLVIDEPRRVVFSWHPGHEPSQAIEVEVRFAADGASTEVELEHRGWETPGERASIVRAMFGGGWPGMLARFSALAKGAR